jgi:predicted AAA+ superfamily ATPase
MIQQSDGMIEDKIKTEDAEKIIRFLAEGDHLGRKFTANSISRALKGVSYRKVSELLPLFTIKFAEIFGYEKIQQIEYFWIKCNEPDLKNWFKKWFGKEF